VSFLSIFYERFPIGNEYVSHSAYPRPTRLRREGSTCRTEVTSRRATARALPIFLSCGRNGIFLGGSMHFPVRITKSARIHRDRRWFILWSLRAQVMVAGYLQRVSREEQEQVWMSLQKYIAHQFQILALLMAIGSTVFSRDLGISISSHLSRPPLCRSVSLLENNL